MRSLTSESFPPAPRPSWKSSWNIRIYMVICNYVRFYCRLWLDHLGISHIRYHTIIYASNRLLEIFQFEIYAYMRSYTFINAYLKFWNFKYTFIFVYIRFKAFLWNFLKFEIYAYMRLYTPQSASLKFLEVWNIRLYAITYGYKRLFGSSRNFKYTFIYEHIRIKALLWNYLLFEICAYVRWYTFIYACLEVLEISNIRLYAFIYVLIRMYEIFEISNIRLYAFIYVLMRRKFIF